MFSKDSLYWSKRRQWSKLESDQSVADVFANEVVMTYVMCLRKPSLHETSWENPLPEPHHWRKDVYCDIVPIVSFHYPRILATMICLLTRYAKIVKF